MHNHRPHRVQPSDEEISSLIRKNKYTDRLRTDLALLHNLGPQATRDNVLQTATQAEEEIY